MDTMTLHCEGSSDDTFGVYNSRRNAWPQEDHDNCASGGPIAFLLTSGDEAMVVVGQYAPGVCGGWLIGVSPYASRADDVPIPAWPMRFERSEAEYSPRLVIEAPADVKVVFQPKHGV